MTAAGVLLVIGAYLIGTFPTAALVGRSTGHDPTLEGSGNPGASNVYRTSGRRAGVVVLVGDVAKGAVAAGAGWAIADRPVGFACWVAAVAGHIFPVTRGMRGGKGVATAGGGVCVLLPLVAVGCIAAFALVVKALRLASIGSLTMAVMVPLGALALGRPAWEVWICSVVAGLVVARHARNIGRLISGSELGI